jgi:hypothetical protein
MAQLKDFQTGAVGDSFNGPVGTTTAAAGAFTTLSTSGIVGIGNSTPSSFFASARNLVVGSGTGNNGMSIYSGSAAVGDIAFADATTDPAFYSGLIRYDHSSDAMRFYTASVERMRISSAGLVGIGTTSPSSYNSAARNLVITNASGDSGITIHAGASSVANLLFTNAADVNVDGLIQYDNTSNFMRFWTNGIDRMRIDSAGNLGLGVTPSAWATYKAIQLGSGSSLAIDSSGAIGQNYYFDGTDYKYTNTAPTTLYSFASGQHRWYYAASGTAGNTITLTQAMTLNTDGDLLVGTTSYGGTGGLTLEPNASNGAPLIVWNRATTVSTSTVASFRNAGTVVGTITHTNTATAYNTSSDYRLKENIVNAPEFGSVIDLIQVRSFDWKTDNTHQRAGFIAQELVTVAPEAVHQPEDTEEMMAVDYSKLVPMLVKEIQSLRKRLADAGI